ncbi:MAG TPA: adenylate/guanylate cyclase domain-containing protein [Candidatus Didemnitutus sp.]|nr:adenylate/guanylate cyclase domain-containing protein [Candidatus Didemnitutus sp.]
MVKIKARFEWRLLLLLPIPALWAWASHEKYLQFLDDKFLDYRFSYRGEINAPVNVIYVDMDFKSISALGNIPWPRDFYAEVGRALIDAGKVKAVGVDMVFSENGKSEVYDNNRWVEGNVKLFNLMSSDPPFVLAAAYAGLTKPGPNGNPVPVAFPMLVEGLPALSDIDAPELPNFSLGSKGEWNPNRVGLIDTKDGGTRWVPLFAPTDMNFQERYDHMALALALLYWGVEPGAVKMSPEAIEIPLSKDGEVRRIPLVDRQLVEINWFSPWLSPRNPRASFVDVYNYSRALKSDKESERKVATEFFKQFAGSVVLIGPVDKLLQDLAVTPVDPIPVPRVSVHGNLLKTIVSGKFLQRLPRWAIYPLTFGLTLLVTLLAVSGGARGVSAKITAVLLLVGFVLLCFYLFDHRLLVLPMAAPLGASFTTAFVGVIWQLVVEEKQKGRIKGMFSTYLAPTVVDRLIESGREPELGGHDAVVTAYFSDIQSFSTFSELMPASQLVELMNEYLTACTDIILEESGTLDKYIGDAVVAIFGDPLPLPSHAHRACVATIRVQHKIEELRQKWRGEGTKWPPVVHSLRARLGLNTGAAILGNMGSRTRMSYTMMGDNVNLAARMESGAKLLGVYTMVTETTRTDCEKHAPGEIAFRALDRIKVKGRSLPVSVHEVVGYSERLEDQTLDCLDIHAKGLERYFASDWDGALELFRRSAPLEPFQPSVTQAIESNPSLRMIDRCLYMKAHPPAAGWDGVFEMKEKG